MSTLSVINLQSQSTTAPVVFQTSTGTEVGRLCRAFVNFDGTTATPSTIRGSFNVSSVTKNGTGDYTVNFTTSLVDSNYSAIATAQPNVGDGIAAANSQCNLSVVGPTGGASLPTSSAFRLWVGYAGTNPRDVSGFYIAVFR